MIPVDFPESNILFGPPPDLDHSQCRTIFAYDGRITGGSLDGARVVVTAWQPTEQELELLKQGRPVLLTFIGGLPPHMVSLDFHAATHPA